MPEAVYSLDKAPGYELHVHQVTQEDDQDLETIRNFLRNFRELLLSLGCNIDDFQGFEEELNVSIRYYGGCSTKELSVLFHACSPYQENTTEQRMAAFG